MPPPGNGRATLIDRARTQLGTVENALLDALIERRIDRRTFLQHATRLGVALPLVNTLAAAVSGLVPSKSRAQSPVNAGIRVGVAMPHGAIDPVLVNDSGSYQMMFQSSEFLCVTQPDLSLAPVLAESWSHDADGSVWTFKLRPGVKFHDGREMTADDVVATFDRLSDAQGASNALSVFKGVLSKGGTRKVDSHTVAFHLDSANGNFPYAVSIDNYNAVILPANYSGNYEKDFPGTGPFRLESYRPRQGASFVRNPDYWGAPARSERIEFKFYSDIQPRLIALQAGEVDLLDAIPVIMTPAIRGNPDIALLQVRSANHRQIHLRCDVPPFNDKRIRQAFALCIDRKKLLAGLCRGMGTLGNDSPFAPLYPSTDRTVAQRDIDLERGRALMTAAGAAAGFDITLTTERYGDIPEYAQLVQNFAKPLGIRVSLNVETQALYYGKAARGQSDWLDSPLGITDYAHRGAPNTLLKNPLMSDGSWNAARFSNAVYDSLVPRYVKALDLDAQRSAAHDIQTLLLEESPVLFAYFPDLLVPVRKGVTGLVPIAAGLLLGSVSRS